MTDLAPEETSGARAQRFLTNVIWSWVGVVGAFFTGFFLSPYIIRKLGAERYGIWALAFAFIDYFSFFDFGFKSAIVNLISGFRAQNQETSINETVNTAFFYFLGIASVFAATTWALAGYLHYFFKIQPAHQAEFVVLVRTVGLGWAGALALNVFSAGLEAFQQFKTINRISVMSLVLRSGGCAIVLFFGLGLKTMGLIIMVSQFINFGLYFLMFSRAFRPLRITPSFVRKSSWTAMARYGVHAFVAQLGTMLQNQGPPMMVGHFLTSAFVGYYTLPSRLLQYMVDLVTRIASVAMPNAAELFALGRRQQIAQMGIYLNRYSFAMFLPLAIFLGFFGRTLIRVWVGPEFAAQAAPLLLPFILFTLFAVAAQFNSVGILFGMAKHPLYSKALITEGLVNVGAMAVVLPRFGILGAAWVVCSTAIWNRGLFTPFLLCQYLELNWAKFMASIYVKPTLLGVPTALLAYGLRSYGITGRNWVELLALLGILTAQYYVVYFFAGVGREHQMMIWNWVGGRMRALRPGPTRVDQNKEKTDEACRPTSV